MDSVFINYRRGETAGEARALFNELAAILGKNAVFMDVDNITLGRDFRQVLQERLASCKLMLALIGRNWLQEKNASGLRRLDDASDFVRLEIEAALKRNIPIAPVLVQGAQMPTVDQLPERIKDFAYRNGFELSHNRWESDVREMFKRLGLRREHNAKGSHELETLTRPTHAETTLEDASCLRANGPAVQPAARKPLFAILSVMGLALAVAGGGFLYYRMDAASKASKIEQERLVAKVKAGAEGEVAAARAEAEKARADAELAKQAREQIEADDAKAAAAQAAKEREEAVAQAKREQIEADKAKATAAQAAKERAAAAAQAKREQAAAQAEKARAAAAQEERDREAAAAQAERDRAAAERAARAERERTAAERAAQAERDRAAAARAAQVDRDRAAAGSLYAIAAAAAQAAKNNPTAPSRGSGATPAAAPMPKFSGSMTRSMGDYARTLGLKQSGLTMKNTMGACSRWSQELPLSVDEGRSFRAVCMSLADYANANGWQLGRMPSPEESMKYCNTRAGSLTGDVRKTLMMICLKYR